MGEILSGGFDTFARLSLQVLLNSLWQGLLVAALAGILLRLMKDVSATTRHAVWVVSLLTIGSLPLIAVFKIRESPPPAERNSEPEALYAVGERLLMPRAPGFERQLMPNSPVRQVETKSFAVSDKRVKLFTIDESARALAPLAGPVKGIEPRSEDGVRTRMGDFLVASLESFGGNLASILAGLWLGISSLMLMRIGHGYASLIRLRRNLEPASRDLERDIIKLAAGFGIRRKVRVAISRQVSMPMTIGAFKPAVILPEGLSNNLSKSEFDSVIAHELAHIRRWDYLTNLLQRLLQAVLFFNPAVWLIGRQMMIERELACDDWAVKTCEPRRYATCLTKLVELLSESKPLAIAAGIIFGKNVISRRVEMILNRNRNATTAISRPAMIYALGLALTFIGVCGLISPVIAVPLAQEPASKQQSRKEDKSNSASQAQTKERVASTAPQPAQIGEPPPAPARAPRPAIALVPFDPEDEDFFVTAPAPAIQARPVIGAWGFGETVAVKPVAPLAAVSPDEVFAATIPQIAPSPRTPVARAWAIEQDDKNKTPAIPETELLTVLTDIVKKDADPAVRNEALQGIYRMRSDAAITTLIQLYDGSSDPKVKAEIIGFLIRRNGDNAKAIAKLMTIAKSEPSEELRARAIRHLGSVKGDDGANNLIQIYDGLQDSKMKQTVVRYLSVNKSRKAIDKLIQIAKNDTDPAVRQSAIRGLYNIDNRLYLEFAEKNRPNISQFKFDGWDLEGKLLDADRLMEFTDKLRIEAPLMELKMKELSEEWQNRLTPEIREKLERFQQDKEKTKPKQERK